MTPMSEDTDTARMNVIRTDAELLRLIAADHQRLAPNAHYSADTLREIADRIAQAAPAGGGWIVLSGDGKRYRTWKDGWSDWTDDREQATRYLRRQDAEAVHSEDEDAWSIEPFAALTARPDDGQGEVGIGFVYWNPDAGQEYAPNHPIDSGECVDAEHIRPSSLQEDTLWQAFQGEFERAHALETALAKRTPATGGSDREDADEFETVEAWEHADQLQLSLLYNHGAHDRPQFNRGQMRVAIRHGKRLAALAQPERDAEVVREDVADAVHAALWKADAEVLRLREALGYDPAGFVAEAKGHLVDMPRCIQRDYLRLALEKIDRLYAALDTSAATEAGK